MSIWDDRILEILCVEGPQTPTKLAERDHIHVGASNISRRLSKLSGHDMAESLGNGVYQVTQAGELYLTCSYDVEKAGSVLESIDEV